MDVSANPQTWHHGVVARWWAEFNTDGPEIGYYRRFIERGQPALDVGCGTGRLLIPFLHDGLDVDGCDVSADMVALCRERAEREGLSTDIRVQAMHALDMPRRYRTIYLCGAFGLGGSRTHAEEALARFFEHLEPGGTLVLDHDVPWHDEEMWAYWTKKRREELPESWHEPMRGTASDGAEYELVGRLVDVDPLAQRVTMELRGSISRDGHIVEQDERPMTLVQTIFFPNELRLMIDRAGFEDIELRGNHAAEEPTSDSHTVVLIARKSS